MEDPSGNHGHVLCPPGESGPRRSTQEPLETAAANAEAARMADELGVSSSVRLNSVRREGEAASSSAVIGVVSQGSLAVASKKRRAFKLFGRTSTSSSDSMEDETKAYQAVPADGSTTGVGLLNRRTNDAQTAGRHVPRDSRDSSSASFTSILANNAQNQQQSTYTQTGTFAFVSASHFFEDDDETIRTDGPHLFDENGHRAPYREGPYDFHHEEDGRLIKKRWYGRMEDGYLAYTSIYLHEYLGFNIYMPLTPEQQDQMKKDEFIPDWMENFSSLPNLAIPLSYFCIGVGLQLLRTPLIVYFIQDLGASAAEVNVLFTVMAVPWCFKVIYGFLSDCLPISGLRRKPYFMTGWLVYIIANFVLMLSPAPGIGMCILFVFVMTAGYMLADVMTDALIVERSKYECQETQGTMQSKGYIIRFFGSFIGSLVGAVVYNKDEWEWYLPMRLVFFINGAVPLVFLLPVVPYLLELDTNCAPKNFYQQCRELFQTVQLRAVWQPMTFVYIYNALQLTNAAWMNFLVEGLDFSAWEIGLVSIFGSIMAWLGIMTYKKFFFGSNWRVVYFWCTTLASVIALGQLILVFGLNKRIIGIPDIIFSMGDDVLVEFVVAVQFLPMCIMYLGLCPAGSEGTTYAMLTTWSNLAGSLAFDISTALTAVWDVSSQTISEGNFSGVWRLSLFCGLVGPIPLLLLGLIPESKEDQRRLQKDKTKHWWAGVIFLSVMILTLAITFVESVCEVWFRDESGHFATEEVEENAQRRLKRLIVGH